MKYRCSRCQTRHRLGVDQLVHGRTPLCKKCGHNHFYKVHNERTCSCDAYHYPHRAGSGDCLCFLQLARLNVWRS